VQTAACARLAPAHRPGPGSTGCSLWAFASQWQRLFLFGCRKHDDTLDQILPPDVFGGIGVSDDAAVYRGRFAQAQKCWAHLLRKAGAAARQAPVRLEPRVRFARSASHFLSEPWLSADG
jgi:hypothetical protein